MADDRNLYDVKTRSGKTPRSLTAGDFRHFAAILKIGPARGKVKKVFL
jgi:hypothetical protein